MINWLRGIFTSQADAAPLSAEQQARQAEGVKLLQAYIQEVEKRPDSEVVLATIYALNEINPQE